MRATVMHQARDLRIENVPDAAIREPTDAVLRITRPGICGSDLWPYNDLQIDSEGVGRRMAMRQSGIVEDVGSNLHRSGMAGSWSCLSPIRSVAACSVTRG
jgi:threonine dehydrogenase-like Zn-dependent dehydrogenase